MSSYSFPQVFRRQLRFWALHCILNALPSLAIALGFLNFRKSPVAMMAMFLAIASFILLYSLVTSIRGPFADEQSVFSRSLKLGTKIRSWISGISLLLVPTGVGAFYTPDFWCGFLAVSGLNKVAIFLGYGEEMFGSIARRNGGGNFLPVYLSTLAEGFLLSILLLLISFFVVVGIQSRDRKRAYLAGNLTGGVMR